MTTTTSNNEKNNDDDDVYEEFVGFLQSSRKMRETARNSLKQAMWAGGGAFAGSLLLGPVGGLVGGIGGSVVGYIKGDSYDGAVSAIQTLDAERRSRLMSRIVAILTTAGASAQQMSSVDDFKEVLNQYAEQDAVRDGVWRACVSVLNE